MATVNARAYLSPTLVLLAMDWPDGETRHDFLGFAIRQRMAALIAKSRADMQIAVLTKRLPFRYTGTLPKSENE